MSNHLQILLQEYIYETLTNDVTLQGLLDGAEKVFDNVPEGEAYPFVTIGLDSFKDWSHHQTNGFQGDVEIGVWSQAAGRKETKEIQNRIWELLHNVDPELAGFAMINFRCDFQNVVKDDDDITHHGVQRFVFIFGGN